MLSKLRCSRMINSDMALRLNRQGANRGLWTPPSLLPSLSHVTPDNINNAAELTQEGWRRVTGDKLTNTVYTSLMTSIGNRPAFSCYFILHGTLIKGVSGQLPCCCCIRRIDS